MALILISLNIMFMIFAISLNFIVQTDETPLGEIAYTYYPDGVRTRLYIMNADGTNARPLTNGAFDAFLPLWSPNGQKLAYLENTTKQPLSEQRALRLMVMNADGTNPVEIAREPENGFIMNPLVYLDWSPDSQRVMYMIYTETKDLPFQIFVADVDGSDPVEIGRATPYQNYALFSATNELLVNSSEGLVRVDLTTRKPTLAADIPPFPMALSPDGRQLAFIDAGNLSLLNINEGHIQKLIETMPGRTEDEFVAFSLSLMWSPDGQYISGDIRLDNRGTQEPDTNAYVPFVVRADGSEYRIVDADDTLLVWSPDSTYIAYSVLDAAGEYQIAIARPNGSGEVVITSTGNHSQPAWRRITE